MLMKTIPKKRLAMALMSTVVVAVVACVLLIWRMDASDSTESASSDVSNKESMLLEKAISESVNVRKLVGRWLRTDSPYVIEIREVSPDGTLRAAYYNPQPINVSAAKVENKNGILQVFVELHDTGYPGSNYSLNYNPENDVLEGTYFQATLQQKFDVVFIRMPAEY
jgi:hypothetical protein